MQNHPIHPVSIQSQAILGNPALLSPQQRAKENNWLAFTVVVTTGCSVSALWLQHYPDWFASYVVPPASSMTNPTTSAMQASMTNPSPVVAPAAPVTSAPETARSTTIAQPSITPVSSNTYSDVILSDIEILEQAKTIAQHTTVFSQTVYSIDDWKLIASRWTKAINLLAAVPVTSEYYDVAQQQIETYQGYLEIAQQKANQPITEISLPTTRVRMSNGIVCSTESARSDSAGIQLSEVKVVAEGGSNYITGCVTNNTNQALHNLTLTYQVSINDKSNPVEEESEVIKLPTIEPGQTAPFQSQITLQPLAPASQM